METQRLFDVKDAILIAASKLIEAKAIEMRILVELREGVIFDELYKSVKELDELANTVNNLVGPY